MKIRVLSSPLVRFAGAGLVLSVLAACGGSDIGSGNGPTYMKLLPAGGAIGDAATKAYECIPSSIQAVLYFKDGSAGDFTGRVTWSTSNSGVASVSNGDIFVNGSGSSVYAKGVLVPAGPGSATITANYSGITADIVVTVGTPANLTIKRVDRSGPVVPTNNATKLGTYTLQDFTVTALIDGVERNVESPVNQNWTLDPNDPATATVTTGGVVTANGTGGPLNLTSTFPACGQVITSAISVADIAAISVRPEFAGNPNLIVGNTEKFYALADFNDGNGPTQDISTQVTWNSSVPAALAFSTTSAVVNLAGSVAAGGPAQVTATFTANGSNIQSPVLNVITVTDTLESITVSPKTASLVASSDQTLQFSATGSYSSGATQDVTRGVLWSLDDYTIANISNLTTNAGVASSAGNRIGSTVITATSSTAAVGTTDTATLNTTSQ